MTYAGVDAFAVTNRPGLLGALLVGVSAAKALAYALKKPIVGVHHLEGHIYSNFLAAPDLTEAFPILILIVSAGPTQIVRMDGHGAYALLGQTRDDAAGEAFDKGARLLGLPYPGGPNLAALAEGGNGAAIPFPRALLGDSLDFSFSGVKTSLRNFMQKDADKANPADVAASYQAAITEVLTEKMRRAARQTGIRTLCMAGGVAANRRLSETMRAMAEAGRTAPRGSRACPVHRQRRHDRPPPGYFRLTYQPPNDLGFDTLATETLA